MKSDYFVLFAHNVIINDENDYYICNLHTKNNFKIPEILSHLLLKLEEYSIKEVKSSFQEEGQKIVEQYITFLLRKNMGFLTSSPECFLKLNKVWCSPHHIQGCILEYSFLDSNYSIINLIQELDKLLTHTIELRLFGRLYKLDNVNQILYAMQGMTFRSIDLRLPYNESLDINDIKEIYDNHAKIGSIIVYDVPEYVEQGNIENVYYTRYSIESEVFNKSSKEEINNLSIHNYMMKNSNDNRRIRVGTLGDVYDGTSNQNSCGNVLSNNLHDILNFGK